MPGSIGLPEILIVAVIALLILGPKRLPDAGRSLGKGLREFKGAIAGMTGDDEDEKETPAVAATSTAPAATPAATTTSTGTPA